jgi:hypothetical protein
MTSQATRADAAPVVFGGSPSRVADAHDRDGVLRHRSSTNFAIATGASSGIAKQELTLISHRK